MTDQAASRATIVVEQRCVGVSVVRRAERSIVLSVVCDGEDLPLVSRTSSGWVLVREASVRTSSAGGPGARLELDQVVELARWGSGLLVVQDASGVQGRPAVSVEALEEVSSDLGVR